MTMVISREADNFKRASRDVSEYLHTKELCLKCRNEYYPDNHYTLYMCWNTTLCMCAGYVHVSIYLTWVLGTPFGSSVRVVHTLNHWAISLALKLTTWIWFLGTTRQERINSHKLSFYIHIGILCVCPSYYIRNKKYKTA